MDEWTSRYQAVHIRAADKSEPLAVRSVLSINFSFPLELGRKPPSTPLPSSDLVRCPRFILFI